MTRRFTHLSRFAEDHTVVARGPLERSDNAGRDWEEKGFIQVSVGLARNVAVGLLYINRSLRCRKSSTCHPSELVSDLRQRLPASLATCELRLRTATAYCEPRTATCDLRHCDWQTANCKLRTATLRATLATGQCGDYKSHPFEPKHTFQRSSGCQTWR